MGEDTAMMIGDQTEYTNTCMVGIEKTAEVIINSEVPADCTLDDNYSVRHDAEEATVINLDGDSDTSSQKSNQSN